MLFPVNIIAKVKGMILYSNPAEAFHMDITVLHG